jgi:DNA-binding response OmpR family regulator
LELQNNMKTNQQSDAKSETARWLRGLFSFTEKPRPTAPTEIIPVAVPKAVPANGQTILVVDDDPIFLKATAMKFESNGFEVITAKDGSEAIQAARLKKPNLVVLDLNFPPDVASGGSVPWDGFRILSWLRRFDEFKITPVVMASIGDPVQSTRLALHSGATAFFHKQMNPNQLLTIVNDTLARSSIVRSPALELNFQI